MTKKPISLTKLVKGKLIDAQKGFVDSWNWLVEQFDDATDDGEEQTVITGIEISYSTSDHALTYKLKTRKAKAISFTGEEEEGEPVTVFSAVPHSAT